MNIVYVCMYAHMCVYVILGEAMVIHMKVLYVHEYMHAYLPPYMSLIKWIEMLIAIDRKNCFKTLNCV